MELRVLNGPFGLLLAGTLLGVPVGMSLVPFLLLEVAGDWIAFGGAIAGGLVGGILTVAAGYMAWHAAQRQLKAQQRAVYITILSRERDILRDELPGILDAIKFMKIIAPVTVEDFDTVSKYAYYTLVGRSALGDDDFANADARKLVEEFLRRTQPMYRERIIHIVDRVFANASNRRSLADLFVLPEEAEREREDRRRELLREVASEHKYFSGLSSERIATYAHVEALISREIADSVKALHHEPPT